MKMIVRTVLPLLAALTAAGCVDITPQNKELLTAGYTAYENKQDAQAVAATDKFLSDKFNTARKDEAYYIRGLAKYRMGKLDDAKADLTEALANTKNGEMRVKASMALGDLAYETADLAQAENMYRIALAETGPGKKPADHAYYRLGCLLQWQARWSEADDEFNKIEYYFSDSEFARLARLRIHGNAWTVQTGAFKDIGLARAEAARLKTKGLADAGVVTSLQENRPIYLVQVGRYATYEQASAALGKVKAVAPSAQVAVTRPLR